VPHYQGEPHFLRLPKDKIATFVSNEDQIYAYVQHQSGIRTMSKQLALKVGPKAKAKLEKTIPTETEIYKVQKGDNLGAIADKYDVSILDLKKWNNIKGNSIALGQNLKIKSNSDPIAKSPKDLKAMPETDKKAAEAIAATDEKDKTPGKTQEYVVADGDNLGSIAKKFGTTIADLKELNNLTSNNIGLGKTLVVSKATLEIEEQNTANTAIVSTNASVDSFKKSAASAKMGEDYYVKKGDSLYSISKKYPGVTISDIKKWNGIKDGDIKPGMKLKING
jgi:membrane-bound lytic murein transglycosylase D